MPSRISPACKWLSDSLKLKLNIQPEETLVETLTRQLGREATYEDVIKAWGGRMSGESIVKPGSDANGKPQYDET